MKVLKNNYNGSKIAVAYESIIKPKYPRKLECDGCESELEYEESDIEMGVLGCMHVKCPLCGYDNMLDDNEHNITLTLNNVEFPTHFFHTSKENGAVDVCNNNKVKKFINNAINYFRANKNDFAYEAATGNLTVHVYRYDEDEDYHVVVSNNYYDTYIPFEKEDYE